MRAYDHMKRQSEAQNIQIPETPDLSIPPATELPFRPHLRAHL